MKPCNARCVGHLPCDLKDVAKAVVVESAHGREVGGEAFGVSGFQLLDEQLDVGGDYFLGGLRLGSGGKGP